MASGKISDKVKITAQERRLKVLELRRGGGSCRAISKQLGISAMQVSRDLGHGLSELLKQEVGGTDELRALELDRLDGLWLANWPTAMTGDIPAGQLILKISQRRAELLGLDAPVKIETAHSFSEESWQNIRGVILTALAAFPEARVAVANSLLALEAPAPVIEAVDAEYSEVAE
jgi:hypothetical protein